MKPLQKYTVELKQIGQNFNAYSNCNSITFTNQGTNDIVIDQIVTLSFGQSFTITGNEGEICTKAFYINFPGGAGTNNCIIIRKYYIN